MSAQLYRVVFCGETRRDCGMADIRRNLARLLRVEAAAVYRLFTGEPVILRRGLDAAEARRFATAMARAGAIVRLEPIPVGPANSGILVERRGVERRQQLERRRRPRHNSFFSDRRHGLDRRSAETD